MAGGFVAGHKTSVTRIKNRAPRAKQPRHDRGEASDAFFTGWESIAQLTRHRDRIEGCLADRRLGFRKSAIKFPHPEPEGAWHLDRLGDDTIFCAGGLEMRAANIPADNVKFHSKPL